MKRPMVAVIALLILSGFFCVLGYLMYGAFVLKTTLDGTLKDVLLVMLGSLGTMSTMVVSYYFGTTQGSMAKDQIIAGKL